MQAPDFGGRRGSAVTLDGGDKPRVRARREAGMEAHDGAALATGEAVRGRFGRSPVVRPASSSLRRVGLCGGRLRHRAAPSHEGARSKLWARLLRTGSVSRSPDLRQRREPLTRRKLNIIRRRRRSSR